MTTFQIGRNSLIGLLTLVLISGGVLATGMRIAYDHFLVSGDPQEQRETAYTLIVWADEGIHICMGWGYTEEQLAVPIERVGHAKELFGQGKFDSAIEEAITARKYLTGDCPIWEVPWRPE